MTNNLRLPEISSDYLKAAEISDEINKKNETLDALYIEWEELQKKLEETE